jgi:hypothetical protein
MQQYRYDIYTNPNPGGANEGNGWYFDYDPNHPYIKHIVTLSPTQAPGGAAMMQRVVGSYKIHQDKATSATDLHYEVGTDVEILTYNTRVSWETDTPPVIEESQPQRTEIDVDWDFTANPVPQCTWVTISTEFILRSWNAITYDNVHFTYPDGTVFRAVPDISWTMRSPVVPDAANIPNITGGYVIAAFDVIDPRLPAGEQMLGEYRLIHQYSFTQSPEQHTLVLTGAEDYAITNFRVGHTYSMLDTEALWIFQNWLTEMSEDTYALSATPVELQIDWAGRLPYPEGEDIRGRLPDIKNGLRKDRPRR